MKIKYFAWLKNITEVDDEIINEKSIKDIKSLKIFIIKKYPKIEKYFKKDIIRFAINLEYITKNKKLQKKDEIALFPPVSGG